MRGSLLTSIVSAGTILFRLLTNNQIAVLSAAPPLIREEQEVIVNGGQETWRLEWKSSPKTACGPQEDSLTCPCIGFAYGESAPLDLVRITGGREVDRLSLTPLFPKVLSDQTGALVQKWPAQDDDLGKTGLTDFSDRVHARPVAKIMEFADYNHDGQATKFFLHTETEPCGKIAGIVIGVTRDNYRLHALGTVLHPQKALVMQKTEWDALLKATGPIEVMDWKCGDHGSPIESTLHLRIVDGRIAAIRNDFECKDNGNRGRLTHREIL